MGVKCQCAQCTGSKPPPTPSTDELLLPADDPDGVKCDRCGRYVWNDCGNERLRCPTTGEWLCSLCSGVDCPYPGAEAGEKGRGDDMSGLDTRAELLKPAVEEELNAASWKALCELDRAVEKHPTWPTRLTHWTPQMLACRCETLKCLNDGEDPFGVPTAESIIQEELSETLEAAQHGDLEAARAECIQAMAMLARLYVHLPYYCAAARVEVQP